MSEKKKDTKPALMPGAYTYNHERREFSIPTRTLTWLLDRRPREGTGD
jgi:hypothetical protein